MAVPTTGELSMLKMAKEKKYDDYNSTSAITGPISLYDLFLGGNANGSGENYEGTNANDPNHPEPDTLTEFVANSALAMSEWYGYDHNYGLSCSTLTAISLYPQISQNCDTSKSPLTFYINNSVWSSATQLYKDIGGGSCQPANAGYYYCGSCSQNGTELGYWTGTQLSFSGCP